MLKKLFFICLCFLLSGCFWQKEDNDILDEKSNKGLLSENSNEKTKILESGNDLDEIFIKNKRSLNISFFICSLNNENEVEKKADEFASKFLMSDVALYDFIERNDIKKWTIEDVIKCEQYFKLDHKNLLLRLLNENLIDSSQFVEFSENIHKKANILGYDNSLYEETKGDKKYFSIGNMIPLANKLCKEEKIGKGRRDDILLELFREDMVY